MQRRMLSSFVNEIVGGVVPKEYIPAVRKVLKSRCKNGVLAGYPLLGLKSHALSMALSTMLTPTKWRLKIARVMAPRKLSEVGGAVLEPMMKVEVVTPEENMGDVWAILTVVAADSGYGRDAAGKIVNAEVPLAQKCLVMQRTCARLLRVVRLIPWSFEVRRSTK